MNKLKIVGLISLGFCLVTNIGMAFAAADQMPTGYYVGKGDGARVALKVFPEQKGLQKAILSGSQSNLSESRFTYKTAQSIIKSGVKNSGIITPSAKPGVYILTLKRNSSGPLCKYTITYNLKYRGYMLEHPMKSSCVYYHGATWGYGTPIPEAALKQVAGLHKK